MTTDETRTGLASTIRFALDELKREINTSLPGIVVSYDRAANRATVQPAIKLTLKNGTTLSYPQLSNLPVLFPTGGGYIIRLPLKPGDPVHILFSQRSMKVFLESYTESVQGPTGIMALNDAVIVPGYSSRSLMDVPEDQQDGIVLQSIDGGTVISLREDGIDLTGRVRIRQNAGSAWRAL